MRSISDALKQHLLRDSEIDITVTGRKSGRAVTVPVWFAFDDDKLYLLPARGSDTQWYKNFRAQSQIGVGAKNAKAEFRGENITDPKQVSAIVEQFRAKYGESGVKLYKKLDVAVIAQPA